MKNEGKKIVGGDVLVWQELRAGNGTMSETTAHVEV